MTSNVAVAPVSAARSWLAIGLFMSFVLASAGGVLWGSGVLFLAGSLGILLPNLAAIAAGWGAQREVFNSPVYAPLRNPTLRRPAIAVTATLMVALLALSLVGQWRPAIAVGYLILIPASVLLQGTRGMVALGNAVLDERQRIRRDAAYRAAYLIATGLLITAYTAWLAVAFLSRWTGVMPPTLAPGSAVILGPVVALEMIYLPALILAWNEPTPDANGD